MAIQGRVHSVSFQVPDMDKPILRPREQNGDVRFSTSAGEMQRVDSSPGASEHEVWVWRWLSHPSNWESKTTRTAWRARQPAVKSQL